MAKLAQDERIVLVAPIYERVVKGELYNTAVVIGPNGQLMGRTRKSSIPLVVSKDLSGYEKYYFRPGNTGFPTYPTPFGITIGVMICYDRHFPEHARLLALGGADLVFVPSATAGMSRYLWEIELKAHAIDNIYYVGGINRVGKDIGGSPTHLYYGSSFFSDYRGQTMTQASDKKDDIIYADIDAGAIEKLRTTWGFFRDRRPDLYGTITTCSDFRNTKGGIGQDEPGGGARTANDKQGALSIHDRRHRRHRGDRRGLWHSQLPHGRDLSGVPGSLRADRFQHLGCLRHQPGARDVHRAQARCRLHQHDDQRAGADAFRQPGRRHHPRLGVHPGRRHRGRLRDFPLPPV